MPETFPCDLFELQGITQFCSMVSSVGLNGRQPGDNLSTRKSTPLGSYKLVIPQVTKHSRGTKTKARPSCSEKRHLRRGTKMRHK